MDFCIFPCHDLQRFFSPVSSFSVLSLDQKKNFGPFIKDDINERGRERVCQKRTFSRQGEGGVVCGRLMINANEWGWPGGVKKYKILN